MIAENLRLDGVSIHLRSKEGWDPSWPDLVCVHGNLGSGRWFEGLIAAYPGRVIAPDLPNFGDSGPAGDCSIGTYGGWVLAIARAKGFSRAAYLGHSLGGAVAMEALARAPDAVSSLVLVDPSPVEGLVTPKEHYPAIEAYKADKAVLARALRGVVPTLADEALFAALVDDAWKMRRDCFIGHAEALAVADFRQRLAGARLPVSVAVGEKDVLISEAKARETADFFSAELTVIPDCGHGPMVEKPEPFNRFVLDALRGA